MASKRDVIILLTRYQQSKLIFMAHMTQEEWQEQLDACGGDMSQDQVINLVFKDGPNALFSNTVEEMKVTYDSMYRYLTSLFPAKVWNDWQGVTEIGTNYHAAYIPFDMAIFQRSMEICSPDTQNECHTDYCEVPQGGISAIPELEMYKTGFKTRPMCIANIRTSRKAKQIAEMIVKERFAVDEQVSNIFYTMALIRMTGHKWVLEYNNIAGVISPVFNDNPYNALQGFRYSYMNPLYPQVGNINNIMPLDLSFLDSFGGALADSRNPNFVGRGARGEPIFELWYPTDWWKTEVLDNPEYVERNKYTTKLPLINGSVYEAESEVIGNFRLRSVPSLPRFAESTSGGLTVVQPQRDVAVDSGNRSIYDYREYRNAPFIMIQAIGKGAGEILSRPAISTGIEGRPIMPITGNGEWTYRNDYDKICNEDLNMPHFRKRYEMGFRMKSPDASWGMIGRAKKLRLKAPNTCDLQPVFAVTPRTQDCAILTIGCNPNNTRIDNNILNSSSVRKVNCSAAFCGDSTGLYYTLKIRKENQDSIAPNQSPLGSCVCGDTVQVFINDEDADTEKIRTATLQDIYRPNMVNPQWTAVVKLASALIAGECISAIGCQDATPTYGNVLSCADDIYGNEIPADAIKVVLDSAISCNVGATVTIQFLDVDGVNVTSVAGTIVSVNPETLTYVLQTAVDGFTCEYGGETAVSIRVVCA